MAHADYNCCAICDSKMAYAYGGGESKKDICVDCRETLSEKKIPAATVEQFLQWMHENGELAVLPPILIELGFRRCFYGNEVDSLVELLGAMPPNGGR